MRKLIYVELIKLRYYRVIWGVVLFAMGMSAATALSGKYRGIVERMPETEYMLFFPVLCRTFAILAILSTAYAINGDFSMRTVQNVLSVGVDVGKYYLSRLFSQMLFVSVLYLAGFAVFVATRIVSRGEVNRALPFGSLMGIFFMMALQLMAYVAIANAVSMFFRNQAAAMAAGELWLFLAIIFDGFRASGARLMAFMEYEPLMVMQRVEFWGMPGRFFALGLKYALSAAVIGVAAAAVGYVRFRRAGV